jgi:hypothetical protein
VKIDFYGISPTKRRFSNMAANIHFTPQKNQSLFKFQPLARTPSFDISERFNGNLSVFLPTASGV